MRTGAAAAATSLPTHSRSALRLCSAAQGMRQYFGESTALLVVLLYRVRRDLIALCITMIVLRYLILSLFTSSSPLGAAARLGQALYAAIVLVLVTALWRETWVGKASALAVSWGMRHALHVSQCPLRASLGLLSHPLPHTTGARWRRSPHHGHPRRHV